MVSVFPNSFQIITTNPTCFLLKKIDVHRTGNNVLSCSSYKNTKVIFCQRDDHVHSNGHRQFSTEMSAMKVRKDNMVSQKYIESETYMDIKSSSTLLDGQKGIGIVNFLKKKTFFITGATGFLAKVLIENILRSTPDVDKIYVLIKARDKDTAIDRLKSDIINTELFRCLRNIYGKDYHDFMLEKLIPVVGDVTEANIGIESELAEEISREVDVIVNSAGNTNFDERYDIALNINTIGPCRLMNFAKRFKRLKLFLHISTAYVNGKRQGRVVEQSFCIGDTIAREMASSKSLAEYMPLLDIESEINLAFDSRRTTSDACLNRELKKLGLERANLYGWQDTYVFTKAMGEMVISNMRGDIPVVIIRPSVIESTCREPFSGWIEGNRMMDPVVTYYGKGQLSGFLADPNVVLDVVPADMVVNAVLAAITKHGSNEDTKMHIYHIASSVTNPLLMKDLFRHFYEHFNTFPLLDYKGEAIIVPQMKLFSNMNDFSSYIWEDAVERTRKMVASTSHKKLSERLKNISMKSAEQATYLGKIYEPYTFYGGRFDNTNTEKLLEELSEEERISFGFDVRTIDWEDYIVNIHIPGLRRHVMKGRGSNSLKALPWRKYKNTDQLATHKFGVAKPSILAYMCNYFHKVQIP